MSEAETQEPGTALALLGERSITATEVFKPGGVRAILDGIKREVATVEIDISTPKGRKECNSLAYKVTRSKTALDRLGKELTDQWRSQAETVHAERRLIEKELDALAANVRSPLTAWEDAEKARVKDHEDALAALADLLDFDASEPSGPEIWSRIEQAAIQFDARDWQEFRKRASDLRATLIDGLNERLTEAKRAEAERAEAARLEAERIERQRQEEERAQAEREAQIAREAAELARQEAQARAAEEAAAVARKAEEDRQRIERAAVQARHEAEERARTAEREAQRRQAAAVEAERIRVQEAERFQARRDLDARIAKERTEAEERQKAAQARAAEEAIEAERQRAAAHAEAEAAELRKRAANLAHRRAINREIVDAIVPIIVGSLYSPDKELHEPEVVAKAIVEAGVKGQIPHVTIEY